MFILGSDNLTHSPENFKLLGFVGAEIYDLLKAFLKLKEEKTEINPLSTITGKKQVVIMQKMEELKSECVKLEEKSKGTKDLKLKETLENKLESLTNEMRTLVKESNTITEDALLNPETIKANNDRREQFYDRSSELNKELYNKKVEIIKLFYNANYPSINIEPIISQSSNGQLNKLIEAIIKEDENALIEDFFTLLSSRQVATA